jgi:Ca2+-binding RTX toxin-like protein
VNRPKQFSNTRWKRISLTLVLVVALSLALGLNQSKTANGQILKQLGLRSGELITVDQPSKSELEITMNGKDYTVDFDYFSNRSKNFRLMVPSETGELLEVEAPPVSTIRGTLRDMDGSSVVGCVSEDGCCAKIELPSGEECFIEPVSSTLENPAFEGMHVVYTSRDVIESGKKCGILAGAIEAAEDAVAQNGTEATVGPLKVAEIAVEADYEFYLDYGSSTTATLAQMELAINIVNEQYEGQVGIRHLVTDTIVRTTRSSNPWTTSNAEGLLNQLRNFYTTGSGAGTISGDLCHLFTGRDLNSGATAGIAYIEVVCNPAFAFGISTNDSRLSFLTSVFAHELGHNWSLNHCNCTSNTMNPFNNGATRFTSANVSSLIAYRDTRTCLDTIGEGFCINGCVISVNDELADRVRITDLDFSSVTGSNVNATTQRDEQDLSNTGSTTWWFVEADSSGSLTVDTFGSDFDTQLHVYRIGSGGSIDSLVYIDDNDDANSTLQSEVTFDVTAGTSYAIRVGGFRSASSISSGREGSIVLNGEFTEMILTDPNCPVRVELDERNLIISGTQGPDTIFVTQDQGTLIVVINNCQCAAMLPISSVDAVGIQTFGGADVIRVNASLVAVISGGFGPDRITGGPLENLILGGPGADQILGGPKDDLINAGRGNDSVIAYAGDDFIDGGDANDVLRGGSGADELVGGLGADSLFGEGGNDTLTGNTGSDRLDGGAGNDSLSGLGGPDMLFGGPGNDELRGGAGFDTLNGSSGTDTAVDNGEVEISIENT